MRRCCTRLPQPCIRRRARLDPTPEHLLPRPLAHGPSRPLCDVGSHPARRGGACANAQIRALAGVSADRVSGRARRARPACAFIASGSDGSLPLSRASSSDPACLAARSLIGHAGRLLCSSDRTIRINGERSHGSGASRDPFPGKRSSRCGRRPAAARYRVRPPASSGADVRCPGDRPEHPASGPPCRWRMRACAQRAEMLTRSGLQVG